MNRLSKNLWVWAIASGLLTVMVLAPRVSAEERKFAVTPAHSPKSFVTNGVPGLPPGGLADLDAIFSQYFDEDALDDISSFAEYWKEISYGDVTVTGKVFGWITVPWVFDPFPLNAPQRNSPANFINLRTGNMISEAGPVAVPEPFAYGAGEDFCDAVSSLDTTTFINTDKCGALVIITPFGTNSTGIRRAGLSDFSVTGINVWTPGERFLDSDGDNRWDALDEVNDQMCHGSNGCRDICAPSVCSISGALCSQTSDCPSETCDLSTGRCTDTGTACSTNANCPGETCVVANGTCSNTTDFCSTNAQCNRGVVCLQASGTCSSNPSISCTIDAECKVFFCQGVCELSRRCNGGSNDGGDCSSNTQCPLGSCSRAVKCVDKDNCPNRRDTCLSVASEQPCAGPNSATCPISGETCGDPRGSGPRGCDTAGCGDLLHSFSDFNLSLTADNPSGENPFTLSGCTPQERIPCTSSSVCDPGKHLRGSLTRSPFCRTFFRNVFFSTGVCAPTNCVPDTGNVQLPQCCEQDNPTERLACVVDGGIDITLFEEAEGIICGTPIFCCEYIDVDRDDDADFPEAFEDFMIRLDPAGRTPGTVWARVKEDYVRNNYPGDVEALVRRTGNNYYDSPDLFIDRGDTKMMQDVGQNQFAWRTPKPGERKLTSLPPGSAYRDEEAWFDQWWEDRYATSPPATWPGGDGPNPSFNSPRMRPFDPNNPVPVAAEPTALRRWFHPDRGGISGFGNGINGDNHFAPSIFPDLELGTDNPPGLILPEEVFGYYDGWVEHDDLPSSKYHREGDKRFGEVTSPGTDTVTLPGAFNGTVTYTAIFGVDLGEHNPNLPAAGPDEFNVAAGPYAVKIHGEKGFDAGDVSLTEWITWRRDGQSPTIAYQWEEDNGPYHPFAGPSSGLTGGPVGFRDYNLDGMIDQGEVRPELSENYSTDSDPFTENDGTDSNYPFNRERLMEDVVEALDPSEDWDEFNDDNAMRSALCRLERDFLSPTFSDPAHPFDLTHMRSIASEGFVSGIVLVPPSAYGDINLFPHDPLIFPFFPIHNEDNDDPDFNFPARPVHKNFNLHFHHQIICEDCRSATPAATAYAAHEYGHAWEGWPDLYDYDVFGGGVDEENCPVGVWDIMAGVIGSADFVHPTPVLKAQACTSWTEPVDLTTILTPGVQATITIPPSEFVRDNSYFFLENEARRGEKYYFWSVGSGFNESRIPEAGLLIMHTDIGQSCESDVDCPVLSRCIDGVCLGSGANEEGLPLQQRTAPWAYQIVQADGRNDLQACSSTGNRGDAGDVWPGSTNAIHFNRTTDPPATWNTLNAWTGLDISNIELDGSGSVRLTLTWVPTTIPSLRFLDPPGGESVNSNYQVRFEATDVFGGTTIQLFYIDDEKTCSVTGGVCVDIDDCSQPSQGIPNRCHYDVTSSNRTQIGLDFRKNNPATVEESRDWNVSNVPDNRYVLFAKLIPGVGRDGEESAYTRPRAGRNNAGNGGFGTCNKGGAGCNSDDDCSDTCVIADNAVMVNSNTTRFETWSIVCVDANCTEWLVNSALTQPIINVDDPTQDTYPRAATGQLYTSIGVEVSFTLHEGSIPFSLGDTFTFTTTGITAVSNGITVLDQQISENPRPAIVAGPLSGRPPLRVNFDATTSRDPNGEALIYSWKFGDGSADAVGSILDHVYETVGTFTAVLRATNNRTGRFAEIAVDITVINNDPNARFTITPESGSVLDSGGSLTGLSVRMDATGSSDSESLPEQLIYQWSFGDGTGGNDQGLPNLLRITEHIYLNDETGRACTQDDPCQLLITLKVTDTDGGVATDAKMVTVGNTIPVARVTVQPTPPVTLAAPAVVRFNANGSTDADDPKSSLTVRWDFGDNSGIVTKPLSGDDGVGTVTHTYTTPGIYRPTAIVSDGHPFGESTWSLDTVITIEQPGPPQAPRAAFSINPPNGVGLADETIFSFNASATDDPDGENSQLNYAWDFGDGAVGTGFLVTHKYAEPGQYFVTLRVTDAQSLVGVASGLVVVVAQDVNLPPHAVIVSGLREGEAPLSLTFDGRNSSDPNSDPLEFLWEFREGETIIDTMTGSTISRTFNEVGIFTVELIVTDDGDESDRTARQTITVNPSQSEGDDGTGQPLPGDTGTQDSANQRPIFCGFGMLGSMLATLVGLLGMRMTRRKYRI